MATLNFDPSKYEPLPNDFDIHEMLRQSHKNIDFKAVNERLLNTSRHTLESWFQNGRIVGREFKVGNLNGDKGDSLSVNLVTGVWSDFASGERGGDLISLYAAMMGISQHEAAIDLAGTDVPTKPAMISTLPYIKPVREVLHRLWNVAPPWLENCPCIHPAYGQPSKIWRYNNESGKPVGYVARYDPAGERKQFLPWTYVGDKWVAKGWTGLRPIYNLDVISSNPGKAILLVEGEKAADAASKMVGDEFIVTTWPGGSNAVRYADFAPIYGRSILAWPDADEAGIKAMADVRDTLSGKCPHVEVLDTSGLPEKWDAADAIADGWDNDKFKSWVAAQFAKQVDRKAERQEHVKVEEVRVNAEEKHTPQPFPKHLLSIPGVLNSGVKWLLHNSKKPQPIYAVASMLTLGSVVLGRKYRTNYGNWSSLYFLVIGKSATGKESVKWGVEKVLEAANLIGLIGPSRYASETGLLSSLIEQPVHVCVNDEFGKTLESANAVSNTQARDIIKSMMEVWGRCDGTMRPVGYSTTGMTQSQINELRNRLVVKPGLTFVGLTTPETYYEALSSKALRDGFVNRILTMECHAERTVSTFNPTTEPPKDLIDWCIERRNNNAGITGNMAEAQPIHQSGGSIEPFVCNVEFSEDALAEFSLFDAECVEKMNVLQRVGLAEMFGRANEIAMRLSLIVAMSCGSEKIESSHARWAIDFSRFCFEDATRQAGGNVAESAFDAAMKDIERLVCQAGDRGLTHRDLRKLSRNFAKLAPRGQMDVLEMLVRDGAIESVVMTGPSGRGKKRHSFVYSGDGIGE